MKTGKKIIFYGLILLAAFSVVRHIKNNRGGIDRYSYRIVKKYPHDRNAFTQGLAYRNGYIFESTGKYGSSGLRIYELDGMYPLKIQRIPDEYFGEGIALHGGRLYQLSWKSGTGFIYDPDTLDETGRFSYPGEGWGLTSDSTRLIMSDGTSALRFLDPDSFWEIGRVQVTLKGEPLQNINELEYINGLVYANIWKEDYVVMISPETGKVTGILKLGGLLSNNEKKGAGALNGLAYNQDTGSLYVTGKNWPALFEVEIFKK